MDNNFQTVLLANLLGALVSDTFVNFNVTLIHIQGDLRMAEAL